MSFGERQGTLPGVDADDREDGDAEPDDEELASITPADEIDIPDFGAEPVADGSVIEDPQAVLDGEPQAVATKKRTARAKKKAAKK
jgi:hypothetical protein